MFTLLNINNLVMNSDWYNISENEATLLIFQRGVTCEESRKVCSKFMKVEKLVDQLTGIKISKKPTSNKPNCISCGRAVHLNINCWGTCPIYAEQWNFTQRCLTVQCSL